LADFKKNTKTEDEEHKEAFVQEDDSEVASLYSEVDDN
jgi:hypothetical protein